MFADLGKQTHQYNLNRARNQRFREREKRTRVYALADAVYIAVFQHRPKHEIDALLQKLRVVTTGRRPN